MQGDLSPVLNCWHWIWAWRRKMTAIYRERTALVWCDDNMRFGKRYPFRFSFEKWRKDGSCHHLAPCSPLYQIPLTTHIHVCVSELGQHRFRQWLIAYSVASPYINQCWLIVNWTHRNKHRWNLNQQKHSSFKKMTMETWYTKWRRFCFDPILLPELGFVLWNWYLIMY